MCRWRDWRKRTASRPRPSRGWAALRIVKGDGALTNNDFLRFAKVNTIFFPLPIITNANIDDYYDPSMNVQSTCFANGKDRRLVADDYFDQFFTGGEKAPTLTP
jgi:hypothetical protein